MDKEQSKLKILRLLADKKDGITIKEFENVYFPRTISVRSIVMMKSGDNIRSYLNELCNEGKITLIDEIAKLVDEES